MKLVFKNIKEYVVNYSWATFYVGLKLNVIDIKSILDYAFERLEHEGSDDYELAQEIAWLDESSNVKDIERTLLSFIDEDVEPESKEWNCQQRRLRYASLQILKADVEGYNELLNQLAVIYADYGYPVEMELFVNYMPPKDGYSPSLHSKTENQERMINKFYKFLKTEKEFFQANCIT